MPVTDPADPQPVWLQALEWVFVVPLALLLGAENALVKWLRRLVRSTK